MDKEQIEKVLKELQAEIVDLSNNITADNDGKWWGEDGPDDHLGNIAGYIGHIEACADNWHQLALTHADTSQEDEVAWLVELRERKDYGSGFKGGVGAIGD